MVREDVGLVGEYVRMVGEEFWDGQLFGEVVKMIGEDAAIGIGDNDEGYKIKLHPNNTPITYILIWVTPTLWDF